MDEIKKLEFPKAEVKIRETYIGEDGKTHERERSVKLPIINDGTAYTSHKETEKHTKK